MPQTPNPERSKDTSAERREVLEAPEAVFSELRALERSLGPMQDPLPEGFSEWDAFVKTQDAKDKDVYTDYASLSRRNEILTRKRAMELLSLPRHTDASKAELVLAGRMTTYFEYLPALVRSLTEQMQTFDRDLYDILPQLSPKERETFMQERANLVQYLQRVRETMDDRVRVATAAMMTAKISELRSRPQQKDELQRHEKLHAQTLSMMRPQTRATFEQAFATSNRQEYYDLLKSLDTELIDVLKGNPDGKLPDTPKDFLPQRSSIKLLQARYTQIQEIQRSIAENDAWSMDQKKAAQAELEPIRKDALQRLIALAQQLQTHQMSMVHLTAVQGQFGFSYDLEGGTLPFAASSTSETHKAFEQIFETGRVEDGEHLPGAKQFHLGRIRAMLDTVDSEFDPNGLESLTDAGAMAFVSNLNKLSGGIRSLMTGWMPESDTTKALDAWLNDTLPLAIQDSLESGVTGDGKPMTKEEKLAAMRDTLLVFRDTGATGRFKESIGLLQAMPPSADFAAQPVQEDVLQAAGDMRWAKNPLGSFMQVGGKNVEINGATAYMLLLNQMERDADAFQNAYRAFLQEMERLVDLRLGLIAETNVVAQNWLKVSAGLATTAGVGLGISAAAPFLLPKVPRAIGGSIRATRAITKSPLGAPILLQGARTYLDYKQMQATSESIERQRATITAELLAAGFVSDPEGQDNRYTYAHDGVKVTVSVKDLGDALDQKTEGDALRVGVDAVEVSYLLYGVYRGSSLARSVTPLVAVDVAVETYLYANDQKANRDFLSTCPAWLLAKLNLRPVIGDSPYGMFATASEWMISDVMTDAPDQNKKALREKMVFAMLHEELRDFPELQKQLYPSGASPASLEEFSSGEFRDIFLRFFRSRIFQLSQGTLTWEQVQEGRIAGANALPGRTPEVMELDVRKAIREAAVFTAQHRDEVRYRQTVRALEAYRQKPEAMRNVRILSMLEEQQRMLGARSSLGKLLSTLSPQELKESKTNVERIADMLVLPTTGAAEGIDMTDGDKVLQQILPQGPLQLRLRDIQPRTVGEKEDAKLVTEWRGVPYHLRPVLDEAADTLGKSVYENTVMGVYGGIDQWRSYSLGSADNIRMELGLPPITPEPTLASVFLGASSTDASAEEGLRHITHDGIALFGRDPERLVSRARMARDLALEQKMAERFSRIGMPLPLMFSSGSPDVKCCVSHVIGVDPKIHDALGPLVAVFFENKPLPKSGGNAVLATFVFGDVAKKEFSLMQNVSGEANLAHVGGMRVVGAPAFPDATSEASRTFVVRMFEGMEERATEQRQEAERHEAQKPERQRQAEALHAGQQQAREQAIVRAKANVGTFASIPAVESNAEFNLPFTPQEKRCYLQDGSYLLLPPPEPAAVGAGSFHTSGVRPPPVSSSPFVCTHVKVDGSSTKWTTDGLGYRSQDTIGQDVKDMISAAIVAPVEGRDEESISKVLRMYSHQVHIPNGFQKSVFGMVDHFYMPELLTGLTPLYKACADKKGFLQRLQTKIETDCRSTISEHAVPSILRTMRYFSKGEPEPDESDSYHQGAPFGSY